MSSKSRNVQFVALGLLSLFVGCKSSPAPENSSLAPKIVSKPGNSEELNSSASEDCGLADYPVSRSNQEMLADVSSDSKKPPNSDLLAKLAIDKDGRVTHLRVLRLAHPNARNWRKINEDALASIKRQHYKPTFHEGKPVVVCADVGVIIDLY